MKTELTEKKIQGYLNHFFALGSARYVINNLFVFQWESDKLFEMRSGLIYEFEIKISRADFKNDFLNKQQKHIAFCRKVGNIFKEEECWRSLLEKERNKYPQITIEQLKKYSRYNISERTPNYFYYAVPQGMIDVSEVPEYAGLVYVGENGKLSVVKKAPILHNDRYTDEELNLSEKFYYNMVKAKNNCNVWQKKYEDKSKQLDDEVKAHGQNVPYTEMQGKLTEAEALAKRYKEAAQTYKMLYLEMCEGADFNVIERHLFIDKIKKYEPNFDYAKFTHVVAQKYEEKYPNRK